MQDKMLKTIKGLKKITDSTFKGKKWNSPVQHSKEYKPGVKCVQDLHLHI